MNKEEVRELLDLYEDVCAANKVVVFFSILSVASIAVTAVFSPITLLLTVPICGCLGLGAAGIKLQQKSRLQAMGLDNKALARMVKSGEISRLYDWLRTNKDVEADYAVLESYDYLPQQEVKTEKVVHIAEAKHVNNEKSNDI